MNRFVLPVETLALVAMCVLALVVSSFVVAALRNPLLHRLGARTIARQPLRAALIVCGLTLSSTVAGSALGAGDTITNTLRSVVAGSLGTVDEVIVFNPPRGRLMQQARALVEPGFGGLAATRLQFFDQNAGERAFAAASDTPAIAAIAPSIIEQVTVLSDQQVRSALPLLALPRDAGAAFGAFVRADGTSVAFGSLADDQVILNQAAATLFGGDVGPAIQLVRDGETRTVRVAAVVQNGGLGGGSPLLVVPLEAYQTATNREGQINQIIVANAGGVQSVLRSDEATTALRVALSDLDRARELHALMGRADVQQALLDLEAGLEGRARDEAAALRRESAQPTMSDEFVRLVASPQMRQRLLGLAWRAGPSGREAASSLRRLTDLNVLDIKQEALSRAESFGSVVTTIFLVLGICSLVAAVLLVFLVFHLLAADRGVELATMRALGMRRGQVMTLFLVEGLVYNLAGAVVGTLLSVAAVVGLSGAIGAALASYGIVLARDLQPASLALAFGGSAIVTLGAMFVAAYRVAHGTIVGGTRGDMIMERPARRRWLFGTVLVVAAGVLWWRSEPSIMAFGRHPLALPATLSLLVAGAGACLAAIAFMFAPRHTHSITSAITTGGCVLIGGMFKSTLDRNASVDWETNVLVVTVSAVVLLGVGVVLVAQLLGPVLGWFDRALAWMPRVRAAARLALSYLQMRRTRAGMTVAMFAVVVCIMVAALTLIDALLTAYGDDEPPVAGFDLRADVADSASFDPATALPTASAITPDVFSSYGGFASLPAQFVEFGLPRAAWGDATVLVADDGLLRGLRAGVETAPDMFDRSGAPWTTLTNERGTAVVVGPVLDASDLAIVDRTLWVRASEGGTPVKLRVVGVADARSSLEAGIYVGQATASGLGVSLPAPTTYYWAVRSGVRPTDAALGLRISFGESGLTVAELDAMAQLSRAVRLVLTAVVQGFMGIGLLAGVAALGLLGVQSVLERRQQLGMLRALGFRRRDVRATLAWEGVTIAVLGLGLGTALGLVLARAVVGVIATANPEVRFDVPWVAIAQAMTFAIAGAAAAISIAAWRAGRVSPAEALRLE